MPLYQIAVVSMPSKKDIEEGISENLIYWTEKPICAKNEQAALFGVAMSDALKGADLNKIQVIVVPFG